MISSLVSPLELHGVGRRKVWFFCCCLDRIGWIMPQFAFSPPSSQSFWRIALLGFFCFRLYFSPVLVGGTGLKTSALPCLAYMGHKGNSRNSLLCHSTSPEMPRNFFLSFYLRVYFCLFIMLSPGFLLLFSVMKDRNWE